MATRRWMIGEDLYGEMDEDGRGMTLRRPAGTSHDRNEIGTLTGRVGPQRQGLEVGRLMMPEAAPPAPARVPGAEGTPLVGDYTARTMGANGFTRRMMDVPESERGGQGGGEQFDMHGAGSAKRTISRVGPDGEKDTTTFNYDAPGETAGRRRMMPGTRFDSLTLNRAVGSRDTGVLKQAGEIRRRMQGDVDGFNQALERDAGRETMMGVEGLKTAGVVGAAEQRQRFSSLGGGAWVDQETGETGYAGPETSGDAGLKPGQMTTLGSGRKVTWSGSQFLDAETGAPVYEKPGGMPDAAWWGMSPEQKLEAMKAMFAGKGVAGGQPGAAAAAGGDVPTFTPAEARANPNVKRFRTTDGRIINR